MTQPSFLQHTELQHTRRLLIMFTILAAVGGVILLNDLSSMAGYTAVLLCGMAPAFIWLRLGGPGIPVLPIISIFYILYFAVPVLTENVGGYRPPDVLRANLPVAAFLVATTAAWGFLIVRRLSRGSSRKSVGDDDFVSTELMWPFIYSSLALGVIFQVAAIAGWLGWAGSFFGVVRAISLSASSVGSFIAGGAIGQRVLRKDQRMIVYVLLGMYIVFQLNSLYLVGALVSVGAAFSGYVVSTRRIPWLALAVCFAIVSVLHEGKGEMRQRYWAPDLYTGTSISHTPGLIAEWFDVGIEQFASRQNSQQSFADRASLLTQLLTVEQFTPDTLPYLDGVTYAYFPLLLVPRFLAPDKPQSQIAVNLLSVRYGFQTEEGTATTTIGLGIIGEAFANFGYWGVILAGLVYGSVIGALSAPSIGAKLLSLGNLLAVVALVTMMDVESDFGYLILDLWQASVAVVIFYFAVRFFAGGKPIRIARS